MKIVIIGTGNVATICGRLFMRSGFSIGQVYGRTPSHAFALADELNSKACTDYQEIIKDADIYIAALSDKALSEMAQELKLPGRLIVHTAGSVPRRVLDGVSQTNGVLYPLQSIRKEFPLTARIPFLVDGTSDAVKATLKAVAIEVGATADEATDEERLKLHVAAVMVNNFTNHLYALAEDFCRNEGLDFSLLIPLIQETAGRMSRTTPRETVTGPAIRNDQATVEKHLQVLRSYPVISRFYSAFTESIRDLYNNVK